MAHTSHVTRRTSHVTRHTSHITRHTSHVTRHTSHVTPSRQTHTSHALSIIRSCCHFSCRRVPRYTPPCHPFKSISPISHSCYIAPLKHYPKPLLFPRSSPFSSGPRFILFLALPCAPVLPCVESRTGAKSCAPKRSQHRTSQKIARGHARVQCDRVHCSSQASRGRGGTIGLPSLLTITSRWFGAGTSGALFVLALPPSPSDRGATNPHPPLRTHTHLWKRCCTRHMLMKMRVNIAACVARGCGGAGQNKVWYWL